MTMCTTQSVNIWQPTRETAAERTRERKRDSFSCLMSRAIMRPIYSHSPAFTGNGFQLQMTHRAFVHVMLTRTLLKWVWISSKSWLWKWGSKTAIWIVGFLLVVATYFYWDLLYISFEELRSMWVLHIHTRFQTFELLYTGHAHHNFSKCEILNKDYEVVDVVPECLLNCCCNLDSEHQCTVSLMLVWNQGWSSKHNNRHINISMKNSLIGKKCLNMK